MIFSPRKSEPRCARKPPESKRHDYTPWGRPVPFAYHFSQGRTCRLCGFVDTRDDTGALRLEDAQAAWDEIHKESQS